MVYMGFGRRGKKEKKIYRLKILRLLSILVNRLIDTLDYTRNGIPKLV